MMNREDYSKIAKTIDYTESENHGAVLDATSLLRENLMLFALQKKADIQGICIKSEEFIKEIKPKLGSSSEYYICSQNSTEWNIAFLAVVCNYLGISIKSLFSIDETMKRSIIRQIIKECDPSEFSVMQVYPDEKDNTVFIESVRFGTDTFPFAICVDKEIHIEADEAEKYTLSCYPTGLGDDSYDERAYYSNHEFGCILQDVELLSFKVGSCEGDLLDNTLKECMVLIDNIIDENIDEITRQICPE